MALTTGNSYTVMSAIEATLSAVRRLGLPRDRLRLAVVGASGSIASAAATLLSTEVAAMTLVVRPGVRQDMTSRVAPVVKRLFGYAMREAERGVALEETCVAGWLLDEMRRGEILIDGGMEDEVESVAAWMRRRGASEALRWSDDIQGALADADVVLVATSSPEELISADMIKPGAVVCDISRPANVSQSARRQRKDVLILDGGVIELPGRPDPGMHFGFPRGLAYACMAETMMLALEHRYEHTSLGRNLADQTLDLVRLLAQKHGFRVAELRYAGRPMEPCDWETVRYAALGDGAKPRPEPAAERLAAGAEHVRTA
jgi:predicted amino acid dehydrogenase